MSRQQSRTGSVDTVSYYLFISLALGLMVVGYLGPEEYLGNLGGLLINWLMQ
jgi:hypothetical protein